jgi:hypothetical protein
MRMLSRTLPKAMARVAVRLYTKCSQLSGQGREEMAAAERFSVEGK